MAEPASEVKIDLASIEGFDEVFSEDGPSTGSPRSGTVQDRTEDSSSSVQESPYSALAHPISVEEAASLLKISTNAVCKRLRKGSLVGKKIQGKFKDEWIVEGAGLIEVLDLDFSQGHHQDGPETATPETSSVQDQTKDSPSSVHEGPNPTSMLVELVEKQAAKLEAAAGQIGYLQAQLESQTKALETRDEQIKLLTDSQHKAGWWSRFCSWFKS